MPEPAMLLALAARNIADRIGEPPSHEATIVYSPKKHAIAQGVRDELAARGLCCRLVDLGLYDTRNTAELQAEIRTAAGRSGLVFLTTPAHATFLFETVGRPDKGLKLGPRHVFSDFCLSSEGLLRTHSVDMAEVEAFRSRLLSSLKGVSELRLTTAAGTDITIRPRPWNSSFGEVYTAPIERLADGQIVIDGCVYDGPPKRPFTLVFRQGRVANLHELNSSDEKQAMLLADLARDENMTLLAEFGIGVNPGARWDADLMESEQARGTCHFGFGHNIEYGGTNRATYHLDLVVRSPSIVLDGALTIPVENASACTPSAAHASMSDPFST